MHLNQPKRPPAITQAPKIHQQALSKSLAGYSIMEKWFCGLCREA